MRPVKDFTGFWKPEKQAILFKWDALSVGNDRCIYIKGITEKNGTYRVDERRFKLFDVLDKAHNSSPSSTQMPIAALGAGVHKMLFCAYSMPDTADVSNEEIIAACMSDPAYLTFVMMGHATITYAVESSVAENAKIVKIHLKSDSDISQNVLGYQYSLDNCQIVSPFPGAVPRGKCVFPPILIPKDSELQIVPLDKHFVGNLSITGKKRTLFF